MESYTIKHNIIIKLKKNDCATFLHFLYNKKLILTFEDFSNKFCIADLDRDINLMPIEIVMRGQTQFTINDNNLNIIVKLHPTEGTHWVLVIWREREETNYLEIPPLFLEEYGDLGSNERVQQFDNLIVGLIIYT